MHEFKTPSELRLERMVRILSVVTLVLSAWTLNRVLAPRESCITSAYIGAVLIEGQRVENCAFESRLRLGGPDLSKIGLERLRKLEDTDVFRDWFARSPRLLVEVSSRDPHAFDLYRGALRLGSAWVDDGRQVRRALAMALWRAHPAYQTASHFELETLADLVVLTTGANPRWTDRAGATHDWARDVRLATTSATFAGYCKSPYRSLAHERACRSGAMPAEQGYAWSLRPLLSTALAREFAKLSLARKMNVIAAVRGGVRLPTLPAPAGTSAESMVIWFTKVLRDHAGALQMLTDARADVALRETARELDVAAPVRWDVTFDLRASPRWREILRQLEGRARFRPRERALVFTPVGEIALPSGLPVEWKRAEVSTEKHVLIACHLPEARAAVNLSAARFFARQTCGTLGASFWD